MTYFKASSAVTTLVCCLLDDAAVGSMISVAAAASLSSHEISQNSEHLSCYLSFDSPLSSLITSRTASNSGGLFFTYDVKIDKRNLRIE